MQIKRQYIFKLLKDGDNWKIALCNTKGDLLCLLTSPFAKYEEAQREISLIKKELDSVLKHIKDTLNEEKIDSNLALSNDMSAEQIWEVISSIKDEQKFIDIFNGLPEQKRKEIADFVFSKCNVFAGNASIFSLRYNTQSAFLE